MSRFRSLTALTVAAAALALPACGGNDDDAVVLDAPSGEPSAIRGLRIGELAFAARPQTCSSTRAVVLGGGDPQPARLVVREGGCFLWANKVPESEVTLRRVGPGRDPSGVGLPRFFFLVQQRSTTPVLGPLRVSSRVRRAEAAEGSGTDLLEGEHSSNASLSPKRAPGVPLRCPTRALEAPSGGTSLGVPYRVTPGGARGAVVLDRRRPLSGPGAQPPPRGLGAIAGLECGERTIAERPAACETARAVVVTGGRPRPRRLRMPRARSCVFWGNADASETRVVFRRSRTIEVATMERRMWPASGVAWDFFLRSQPGTISYTVEPGGAKGSIELE